MKMLWYTLLICGSILPSYAMDFKLIELKSQSSIQSSSSSSDKIELRGTLKPQGPLRSGGDALVAIIQGNSIQITFLLDVGPIYISVEDSEGTTVKSIMTNSNVGNIIMPLAGLPSGDYSIIFNNEISMMWGDFKIY